MRGPCHPATLGRLDPPHPPLHPLAQPQAQVGPPFASAQAWEGPQTGMGGHPWANQGHPRDKQGHQQASLGRCRVSCMLQVGVCRGVLDQMCRCPLLISKAVVPCNRWGTITYPSAVFVFWYPRCIAAVATAIRGPFPAICFAISLLAMLAQPACFVWPLD